MKKQTQRRLIFFIFGGIIFFILSVFLLYYFNISIPLPAQSITGGETLYLSPPIIGGVISAIGAFGSVIFGEYIRRK